MSPSALFVTTVPVTLEVFLTPFARHFRAEGWHVDALANGAASAPSLDGVFDQRFDVAWTRNPLSPRNLVGTAGRIRRIVTDQRYDIVHVHTPIAAFVTRFALRGLPQSRRPVVIYTAHGFHFYQGQNPLPHALYRTMERIAARWTDFLVTINQQDFAAARTFSGIDPAHVRLIPGIGVDLEPYAEGAVAESDAAATRAGLDVGADDFLLLMIAEFGAVKRHAHLLDALAQVKEPRVVTAFVGDGPLEADVRREVARLGLTDRVRFAGYRRDIPALLAASDALVLVSEREGLARSVLEAMASARAVIGTDTRGIADAVSDAEGWIVPKHDAEALAAAIDHAATHPDEVRARGLAGRARASREFALPAIITRYEELYREALASRL